MGYLVKCHQCRQMKDRKDFQNKRSGFHPLCKTCRKKIVADRARIKYRIKGVKKNIETQKELKRRELVASELQREHTLATASNRNRLKDLTTRVRMTRATIRALEIRQSLQAQWDEGLEILLTRNSTGEAVPSLRDYMEGRQI